MFKYIIHLFNTEEEESLGNSEVKETIVKDEKEYKMANEEKASKIPSMTRWLFSLSE